MNPVRFGNRLLAGASVLAFTTVAQAQAQAPAAPSTEAATAPSPTDEIVVTGSRTIRNGDNNPSPATVIATQDILQIQPGTLSDALNVLPVFAGSRSTSSNPTYNGSQTGGNANSNQLNLRNLGVTRTLVLMDGYRVPPTSFNNVVDVDIIPSMLVQRVDTVTGGVSAVYGSDAVAGVVNYIIDRKFTGIRFETEAGVSQRNDNDRFQIGIAAGTKLFGGRGHLEASYQFIDERGINARSDRPWINLYGVAGSGTAAAPYILYNDLRQSNFTFGGRVTCGTVVAGVNNCGLNGQTFATDGVLRPFVNGTATATAGLQVGGDGAYYDSQLIAPLKAHQMFARYDHDLSDNLRAYFQFSGNIKRNTAYADALRFSNVGLQSNNPFLSPAYRTQLSAAGSTFRLSELMGNFSRLYNIAKSKQFTYSGGLEGALGAYRWGANFTHGTATIDTTIANNPNNQRIAAALDAVTSGGQIMCYAATQAATAAAYADCVPLNIFGPSAASQAALNYVLQPTHYHGYTVQDDFSAHVAGSPFSLPAGPVELALSGEWRKLSFRGNTTGPSSAFANCTNLRTNCSATTALWGFGFADSPKISQTVKEGAIEADVPLLAEKPLFKLLSINGAARYTSYNTSGNYWTWKVGGLWRVSDSLRFRATRSRDIRAPTLYELFAPLNSVPIQPQDLLTGLSPTVPSTDLSNPDLTAEIANTITGGFSWTPVRGLSFTVDAYKIKIGDAVAQVSGSAAAFQNLCYASAGTSFWCTLQVRPNNNYTSTAASNAVQRWYVKYLNFANIETKGVDFEANYASQLFGRPMSLRLLTAYQPHAYYRLPNVPTIDQGNVAFGPTGYSAGAAWRIAAFARFSPLKNITLDVLERWRSSMKIGGDESLIINNNRIDSFATTNVTLSWAMRETALGQAQIALNVSNLFDAHSPGGAYTGNGTRTGLRDGFVPGDDVVGRAFSVALRIRH